VESVSDRLDFEKVQVVDLTRKIPPSEISVIENETEFDVDESGESPVSRDLTFDPGNFM
jgi:hypothetical protein